MGPPAGTGPAQRQGSLSGRSGAGTSFGVKGLTPGACRGRGSGSTTSMTSRSHLHRRLSWRRARFYSAKHPRSQVLIKYFLV